MYSWVALPHTSGILSKHTFSNAQGDPPSEGEFDALPSTWETLAELTLQQLGAARCKLLLLAASPKTAYNML